MEGALTGAAQSPPTARGSTSRGISSSAAAGLVDRCVLRACDLGCDVIQGHARLGV